MGSLVSAIIPTFNRGHSLTRAIDSVLQQTHRDVEVVVVDDGSTDQTAAIVKEKYGELPAVRYSYQTNRGVAAARNTGLKAARGDFVAFLDSDDVWKPWKIELQLACLRRFPHIGMIWSDMEAIAPDGTVASRRYLHTMYANYRRYPLAALFAESAELPAISRQPEAEPTARLYAGDIFSPMVTGNLVHTSTVLLRRERLDRVQAFSEELRQAGEDYDFHLRTCREGPVGFIDLPTISYQIGMPDQLARQSYWVAQNFLRTLTTTLERDKDRIVLPPRLIREVLAEANAWVAETLIAADEPRRAATYLRASLRQRFWQSRALAQFLLCQLPPGLADAGRRTYRGMRSFAPSRPGSPQKH